MKLAVLIGGRNYSADCPLLYYGGAILRRSGFETVKVTYGGDIKGRTDISIPERIKLAKPQVMEQLKNIPFTEYERVVFISKSIGTVLAGYSAKQLNITPEQVFLTPLEQTLEYMDSECVSVSGRMDKYLAPSVLSSFCREKNIIYKIYEAVGHSLESDDNDVTFRILKEIADFYSALATETIEKAKQIFIG